MPFIAHKTLVAILEDDYISDKIFDVSSKSEEYSDKLLYEAIGVVLKGDNDYAGYVECNPLLFQEVQKRVKEKLDSCLFFQKQLRSKRHADDVNPIVTKIVKKLRK